MTDRDEDYVNDPPYLADEVNFQPEGNDPGHRWIVLYPEDYDDFAVDVEDNLALNLDMEQCGELIRLASSSIASMSARDADSRDVIKDLIAELERQLELIESDSNGDADDE